MQNHRATSSDQDSDTAVKRIDFSAVLRDPAAPADPLAEPLRRLSLLTALAKAAGQRHAEGARFATFCCAGSRQRRVLEGVQEWAAGWLDRREQGLVLYGPVGTGKDHLAYSACRALIITHGASVRWINGRDLAGEVRDRIESGGSERELIARLTSPDVLVLSDPVPQLGELTPHQADMIYRIVESRWRGNRCTVLTLNVADDGEADRRLGAGTWDRVCDEAWKIRCAWRSSRKPAKVIE